MSRVSLRVPLVDWDDGQQHWTVDVVPAIGLRVSDLEDDGHPVAAHDWEHRRLASHLELAWIGPEPQPRNPTAVLTCTADSEDESPPNERWLTTAKATVIGALLTLAGGVIGAWINASTSIESKNFDIVSKAAANVSCPKRSTDVETAVKCLEEYAANKQAFHDSRILCEQRDLRVTRMLEKDEVCSCAALAAGPAAPGGPR